MKKAIWSAAVVLAGLSAGVQAEGDAAAGESKAGQCAGCHGVDGISNVPLYPNLAGQKEQYLISAMQAYKTKERDGGNAAVMWGIAAGLSEQDIRDLAAYYASLDPGS